jgi:hypothetical protein
MTEELEKLTASCPPAITHSPIGGMRILYPFIVIEEGLAISEATSMKHRVVAPIQRLLEIQVAVQKASHNDLDPLVWGFTHRENHWQLYAGIVDQSDLVRPPLNFHVLYPRVPGTRLTNVHPANIRPLEWYDRLARWSNTNPSGRGLPLEMGS